MKLRFTLHAFLILFLILFVDLTSAQSGKETLKKIQTKFKSINNFSADFSQTISDPEGKQGGKLSGKFYYKRKNKFIVETKSQNIISDGTTVWNYNSRQKRVVISSLSDESTSFSLERYIFDYPALCNIKSAGIDGKEEVIELVSKDNNNIEFNSVKIWKTSDDMISKMEIIDLSGAKYIFKLSNIKTDQDMPDSKFTYTPSKGIKIIDIR
jgi:outer membrane lipoprotein carrier protein